MNGIDRRLKERLVGAAILVVLVVLIVPELLRGPAPSAAPPALPANGAHTVTVDVQHGPPAGVDAAVPPASGPERPPSTAVPMTPIAAPDAAGPAPAPADAAPAAAGAPAPDGGATAPAASGLAASGLAASNPAGAAAPVQRAWSAQLGSFAQRPNADTLVRTLRGKGFSVYELSGGSGASARYRVRVGPLADRAAAESTVAKLKSQGYFATPVAPGK